MTDAFSLPIVSSYAEAINFLDNLDLPFTEFVGWGFDVQVVHAEIDYLARVRWRDVVRVDTRCGSTGRIRPSGSCGRRCAMS